MLIKHLCDAMDLNISSSSNKLEYSIADIQLWMTQTLFRLNYIKTNIIYLASTHCLKSIKHQHYTGKI